MLFKQEKENSSTHFYVYLEKLWTTVYMYVFILDLSILVWASCGPTKVLYHRKPNSFSTINLIQLKNAIKQWHCDWIKNVYFPIFYFAKAYDNSSVQSQRDTDHMNRKIPNCWASCVIYTCLFDQPRKGDRFHCQYKFDVDIFTFWILASFIKHHGQEQTLHTCTCS